ncbi:hypothetical protein O181_045277 [Austropuccinia psidii MF-1]|uniref:Uncharacterized protein n=1 Tax=Austropuccinia psidii MF-1 TaxID=1389203 RepID=A0A9Q3DTJ7_9BASI|nr:hypothetical protein [Austropuccinia psidii MF-1]
MPHGPWEDKAKLKAYFQRVGQSIVKQYTMTVVSASSFSPIFLKLPFTKPKAKLGPSRKPQFSEDATAAVFCRNTDLVLQPRSGDHAKLESSKAKV